MGRAYDVSGRWLEALMLMHVAAWVLFLVVFTAGWETIAFLVTFAQAGTASLGTTVALRHRSLRRGHVPEVG